MPIRPPTHRLAIGVLSVLLLAAACQSPSSSPLRSPGQTPAPAAPDGGGQTGADLASSEELRAAVSSAGIGEHLEQLMAVARANAGVRAAGTAGYTASAAYVAEVLSAAGYDVTVDEFVFPFFAETAPVRVEVGGRSYSGGDHLRALIFSASGDLTAPVATVAVDAAGQPVGSGGCDREDWEDFPAGSVALVGAGPCVRRQMVEQAQLADAAALVISSPAYEPGTVRRPTLFRPDGVDIPVVYASNAVGAALREGAREGASAHLVVRTLIEDRLTANVIAERAGSGPGAVADEVVMAGGHLDSVIDGPGINDNGSGTMTILEIAEELAALGPAPRPVRFAFWSAEELGLYGSRDWVDGQSAGELDRIVAYLNLDMLASPNYVRQVYDLSVAPGPSDAITEAFGSYFDAVGLTWEPLDLGGGSDHGPFMDAGVPVGGLFSGATELKTDGQARRFGGSADEPMSPCYHLACDTLDEINFSALDELSDAAAHMILWLLSGGPD